MHVFKAVHEVHGNIGFSAEFLIGMINKSLAWGNVNYEEDGEDGGRCRVWVIRKEDNEVCRGTWISLKLAKAEGWVNKSGSKWQTMPEQMLRYRAVTFWMRTYAPELLYGLNTTDELEDIHAPAIPQSTGMGGEATPIVTADGVELQPDIENPADKSRKNTNKGRLRPKVVEKLKEEIGKIADLKTMEMFLEGIESVLDRELVRTEDKSEVREYAISFHQELVSRAPEEPEAQPEENQDNVPVETPEAGADEEKPEMSEALAAEINDINSKNHSIKLNRWREVHDGRLRNNYTEAQIAIIDKCFQERLAQLNAQELGNQDNNDQDHPEDEFLCPVFGRMSNEACWGCSRRSGCECEEKSMAPEDRPF